MNYNELLEQVESFEETLIEDLDHAKDLKNDAEIIMDCLLVELGSALSELHEVKELIPDDHLPRYLRPRDREVTH
ncbi:hypothetical protein N9937_01060 [bacterium]|nr:hypothetical protein [bacterium]